MSFKERYTNVYDAICDGCGNLSIATGGRTASINSQEALQMFRDAGWVIRKGRSYPLHLGHVYCPECAKKRGLKNE